MSRFREYLRIKMPDKYMKRLLPIFFLTLFLPSICLRGEGIEKETYTGIGLEKDFGGGFEGFVDGMLKHRGLFESEYFRKIEVGGEYEVSNRLSVRGSVKGLDLLGDLGWNRYYVPGVGASLKWYPSRFEVDFRNILEFWHALDDQSLEVRLKQRLKISTPIMLKDFRVKPYLSEEYLAALNSTDHLIWNRITAGNTFYLPKGISLDAFYLWQKKNGSLEWKDAHVLGCKVKFSF